MSEMCDENCAGCDRDCAQRENESLLEAPHELSDIKNVIGVVSGKGGVGKSMVASMLALAMRRKGHKTAILDADVTGPSIPRAFGVRDMAIAQEMGIFPVKSKTGISIMSINLLLQHDTDPVVWRGPAIAGTVKQFWTDVIWGDVDFLFVDLPPGTGDVPLTVFQSIPLSGIVVVTSPQELVGMIVQKAVNMAAMMNIPILALVENMSYFTCQKCGEKHYPFGESLVNEIAVKHGMDVLCKMPINPKLAVAADTGTIELIDDASLNALRPILEKLEAMTDENRSNV